MEIKDYSLEEYLQLNKEEAELYNVIISALPIVKTKKMVMHLKFKHVERLKSALNTGDDEELIKTIARLEGAKPKDVLKFTFIRFFGLLKSVTEQIEQIVRAEENSLIPNRPNVKWELVKGGERMAKFGMYNTLEKLSGGDATKYEKYLNMKYSLIFTILAMRTEAENIAHEMEQIKIPSI